MPGSPPGFLSSVPPGVGAPGFGVVEPPGFGFVEFSSVLGISKGYSGS